MRLDDLLLTVAESAVDDWEKVDVRTEFHDVPEGGEVGAEPLEPSFHHTLAVFRPNVDISLAYGATVVRPFEEPWTESFGGPASLIAVWFRYRGAVVYERVVVSADGGRCVLPLPRMRQGTYVVDQQDLPMAQLLFSLLSSVRDDDTLDAALARAGLAISF